MAHPEAEPGDAARKAEADKRDLKTLLKVVPEQKQAFITGILEGKTYSRAYTEARPGCNPDPGATRQMGYLWANQPEIREAIEQGRRDRCVATGVDTAYVVLETVDVYNEAREQGDRKGAMRALELLAKHVGGFDKGTPGGNTYNGPVLIKVVYEGRGSPVGQLPVVVLDDVCDRNAG